MATFGARPIWLVGAALLAPAGCDEKKAAAPIAATMPAGQKLKLLATDIADMKTVSAEITSRDQADARARIPGTLVSLTVRAGDSVTRGQRIGIVTDARLGYETVAASAQVAAADAEAVRARAELARIDDLYRNRVYAKARLDTAVATARAADARVAAARAQQGASASIAGQGAVLAPANGWVLRADVPAGSVVSPGQSIATITAGPPVLRLMLPETLAGALRVGAPVTVTDPVDGARAGRIVQIYPAISGGQVIADASLPGLSERFIGRRISVAIETGRRTAIVVPRRFVTTRFGVDYLDVVSAGQVSAVPVQTTPVPGSDAVEILSGVGAGDTLFLAAGTAG
ncbi:MAG: efflux transporter periplasmic adaptor subunit [Alphaproteobacteria bacterium]|nr:MAG: efflux transporter periplasmic adaptor subunit [Alphaproteobacteria bacterium]